MGGEAKRKSLTSPSRYVTSPSTTHHHSTWAAERTLRNAARRTDGRRRGNRNVHILEHVLLLLLLERLRLHLLLHLLLLLLLLLLHLLHPALILIIPIYTSFNTSSGDMTRQNVPECYTLAYPYLLLCRLADRSLLHRHPSGRALARLGPAVAHQRQRQHRR